MKTKKIYVSVRLPKRLHDMVSDMMMLLGADFTTALEWILEDWEKNRYLNEKERLLALSRIRYVLLEHEAKKPPES